MSKPKRKNSLFPRFVFVGDAPDGFKKAVKRACAILAENYREHLPQAHWAALERARVHGFDKVIPIKTSRNDPKRAAKSRRAEIHALLPEVVFELIPKSVREDYLPFCNADFVCGGTKDGKGILVLFFELLRASTPWGTAYYSANRPTVSVGGEKKIVAFSDHAVRNIEARLGGDPLSHGGSYDAFAYMRHCVYFEPAEVTGGARVSFAMFERSQRQYFSAVYCKKILGKEVDDSSFYYRLGYAPADVEGEFLRARTLLLPGMDGTAEYHWYLLHHGEQKKQELRKRVDALARLRLEPAPDFSLLREFHAAIPQVVQFDFPVFRYPHLKQIRRLSSGVPKHSKSRFRCE